MKSIPLVSVIVPVYRVEKYLEQCISSIVSQTYSNLEIILVDDGSPDNCGKICDAWADKDARVRVIHQENGGLSAARNAGLDVAKGKYISFVDSDDWLADTFLSRMVQECEENHAEMCIGQYESVSDSGRVAYGGGNCTLGEEAASGKILLRNHPSELFAGGVPFRLYAKALIERVGLRFPIGRIHEDLFTLFRLTYHAEHVRSIPDRLYFYRQNPESITHTLDDRSLVSLTELQTFRMDYMRDKEDEFYHRVERAAYQFYFGIIKRQDKVAQDCGRKLHAYLAMHSEGLLKNPYASHVEKRRYLVCFVLRPFLHHIARRLLPGKSIS